MAGTTHNKYTQTPQTQQTVAHIFEILGDEYDHVAPRIEALFADVDALYAGQWPSHEACGVTYHNFDHALDVSLAVARMISGWNKVNPTDKLSEQLAEIGLAAAIFHDSGYIKEKGDQEGTGGKFTLIHVDRGQDIARDYLENCGWLRGEIDIITKIISVTEYSEMPNIEDLFGTHLECTVARLVATADLVAQMADTDYINRIDDLFAEFKEVYAYEKAETLAQKGTKVYKSVQEIKDGTISFYENFVVPTLHRLGRMDRYLATFFGEGRNPYQENITANLTSHLMDMRSQWRRIGDILEDLGLATPDQVQKALNLQRDQIKPVQDTKNSYSHLIKEQLIPWFHDTQESKKCLGDILMEMNAVSPQSLAKGLLAQMLPDSLYAELTPKELHFLLQISMLLQNICKGPWILGVVMEMVNVILDCEASSILIVDEDEQEMLFTLPTGPKRKSIHGKGIPVDKGLSGWVYLNGQAAAVSNVNDDDRFDHHVDEDSGFDTRSILAVPLHLNGECIGVVETINKSDDNFTQHDMNVLTILANMLANVMVGILYMKPSA